MKIDAISITSKDLNQSVVFYSLLGLDFPPFEKDEQHIEPIVTNGGVRLMIDSASLIESITGMKPVPPTHSSFAILCASPAEVNITVEKIKKAGFSVAKEPWDAFWGQRYAIIKDPDGYMVDLFATL